MGKYNTPICWYSIDYCFGFKICCNLPQRVILSRLTMEIVILQFILEKYKGIRILPDDEESNVALIAVFSEIGVSR